ncbi:RNA-guided pseudouridylation complex pseudouridine synthase subunit Cbf5 [Candidatus Woesearchaeota archaeon]|nr:RNA-guided pseudouridylation complex pseudouridine synthase subunit Cbf5 [Candidatus Woesearchaeota archaeon]
MILVKKKAETNPDYGKPPEKRTAEELINYGVVNIDKPQGPSSHEITSFVKKILEIKKAGHSGTLDPKVTGVLPTTTGKATRIVQTLLKAGKEYVAIMHLHKKVDEKDIKKTFKEFTGKIKQLPPVKSAVKRQVREREIYYLDILEIDKQDVLFKIGCEAGTYIRKLIHDIGEKLKGGAHMVELRRTKAGPFDESTLVTLHDLTDAYHYYKKENKDKFIRHCIKPVEFAAHHLAKIWVPDQAVDSLAHGIDLKVPGISKLHDKIKKGDTIAVMTLKDELIAIGTARMSSEEIMEKEKGNAINIKKVFIQPDVYPKMKS